MKDKLIYLLGAAVLIIGTTLILNNRFEDSVEPGQPFSEVDINDGQIIAVRIGGINNTTGDLWFLNYNGTARKQVTNTGNIQDIFSWSPDNKYLAVSIQEKQKGPKGTSWYLGAIEVQTGKVIKLGNKENGEFNVYWLSNNELVDLTDTEILKTKLPEGSTAEFLKRSDTGEFNSYSLLSSDKKWLASSRSPTQPEKPTITTYDIDSQKFYVIVPEDIFRSTINWDLGWRGNKLLYLIDKRIENGSRAKIWQSNADGSGEELLLDTILDKEAEDAISIEQYNSENFLLYKVISHSWEENTKLMTYNFVSKNIKEISLSEVIKDSGPMNNFYRGANLGTISVSPDDRYITFKVYSETNSFVYTIELATDKTFRICENSCFDPVWSN